MSIVKCGLIQTSLAGSTDDPLDKIREAQIEKTLKYIDQAGAEGVQIICMQEIFTGPYFCAEQSTRWYDSVEKIPDGPTTRGRTSTCSSTGSRSCVRAFPGRPSRSSERRPPARCPTA